MKNLLISLLFACTQLSGISQIIETPEQVVKRNTIGISGHLGYGAHLFNIASNLRYAYLFPNRFELGANAGFAYTGPYYKSLSLGVDLRYYLNDKRISPFLEYSSGISFTKINYLNTNDLNASLGSFNDGNNFGIGNSIGMGVRIKSKNQKFSIDGAYQLGALYLNNKLLPTGNTSIKLNYHF